MTTPDADIKFLRMTTDHLAPVLAIERRVFGDPWSDAAFLEVLSFSPHNWVALAGGEVAGYLMTQWVLDEIHILNVAVDAARQRQGIGRRLLAFLLQKAARRGMRDLFLEVRIGNAAAIALYRSFGFADLTRRKRYYPDGEDALVMHCRLAAEPTDETTTDEMDLDTQR
jgi:ribosomal-protein-alanine N-acetyltransferase